MFHGISLTWLVLSFSSFAVREAASAERLVIILKDNAAVASNNVFLEDVAELRGTQPDLIEKLAQIPVAVAPRYGETTTLSRHQIRKLIESAIEFQPSDLFGGAAAVQISLQGRQVRFEEIACILKSHILESTQWKKSDIEIRSINNLQGIEIPPVDAVLRIASNASIAGKRRIMAPIEVHYAGKCIRSFWITAEVCIRSEVLTAAKRINAGTIISSDDFTQTSVEIADFHSSYVRNPEDILGKIARRNLSPGDPLTREYFTEPLMVRNGETVRLRLERNGIVLTSLAKAEQDGKLGQMIRIRNIDFSTLLNAQVIGRAEVRLQ